MDRSQEWRAWLPKGLWDQAIVTLLLEQPVKPDIESRCQGPWEVTPLQQAGYHGRAECAKILLRHGASTTSRSGPGCGPNPRNPLHFDSIEGRRNNASGGQAP